MRVETWPGTTGPANVVAVGAVTAIPARAMGSRAVAATGAGDVPPQYHVTRLVVEMVMAAALVAIAVLLAVRL